MFLRSTGAPVVVSVACASSSLSVAFVDEVGSLPLVLDRLVPDESGDHLGVAIVDEERSQRLADLALVVVDQEVGVRRVVEHSLFRRDAR